MESNNSEEDKKVQVLKKIPFLCEFAESELRFLLSIAKWMKFNAGDTLCKEGSAATSFYIILKGSISVHKMMGKLQKTLCTVAAGQCFGEMSLILEKSRSADIIADEETYLLQVDSETLHKEDESPLHKSVQYKMYKRFSRILAERLQEADQELIRHL